jgi:formate dehydrogenase assembly factor FdhD
MGFISALCVAGAGSADMTITTEESPAAGEKMTGYVCSDCRNHFMQPPRCMTCGAQQLYDNTVKSQGKEIERQAEQIEKLRAALESAKDLFLQDKPQKAFIEICAALGEKD